MSEASQGGTIPLSEPIKPPAEEVSGELEVLAPTALHAMEKASVDVQVSTAHAYPRSIKLFRQRALSMATADVETAESCLYRRPVGKKQQPDGSWKAEFAEGKSIRLAEIVAASYGNVRAKSYLVEQTPRFVRAEGFAWDLESNYAASVQGVESTVDKQGRPYSDRMRVVAAKALMAKVFRDAIFKVVPSALCKSIYVACAEVALGKGKTIQQRRDGVKAWLASTNVAESRMFAALSLKGWDDVGDTQLELLTGLRTAIADGDISPEDAFPTQSAPVQQVQSPPAPPPVQAAPPIAPPPPKAKGKGAKKVEVVEEAPPPASEAPAEAPAVEAEVVTPAPAEPGDIVKQLQEAAQAAEIAEPQIMAWLRTKRLAREDQKRLHELSTAKLENLATAWEQVAPEIKAVKV